MRRVLVAGAGGQLGREMVRLMAERHEVVALSRRELDVTDLAAVRAAVAGHRPDALINCAAYTQVDRAEIEPAEAYRVNALGVRNLALACQASSAVLVHFSTDYVFDGEKQTPYTIADPPRSLNVYGSSKLMGERYVQWLLHRYYVVRTSWLYGPDGDNFVETMLRLAPDRAEVTVVADQVGRPTYTADLVTAIPDLLATGAFGVYHITNRGEASRADFARKIFALTGRSVRVIPTTSDRLDRSARRPMNSRLDPFPLKETIGYLLPAWEDALARYLQRRQAGQHGNAVRPVQR